MLSYQANDWLMRKMASIVSHSTVTAVHAYEDCSLGQFKEAKKRNKACIYDMPIGYYPAWQEKQAELASTYSEWLPAGGLPSSSFVRPEQKKAEMILADLVLAPSRFVERTIRQFYPDKKIALAPYGVDLEFWSPPFAKPKNPRLHFIYAGAISLRKGIPDLLLAWERAGLRDATLELVGSWWLCDAARGGLPRNVAWTAPCSAQQLRERFREADVFVFPSHFEGFGLVLLEAMACGLPVLASDATAAPDIVSGENGIVFHAGDSEALVAGLRQLSEAREKIAEMGRSARRQAEKCNWSNYRECVRAAVRPFV